VCRQGGHHFDEAITDGFCGVVIWEVDEHYVAGGAFDQGRDRGLVVGAGDEIAFPVAGYGAVLDLGRPLGNHDHGVDEPGLALLPGDVGFTAGPAGAQCCLDLAFESASGLDVQGLVNPGQPAFCIHR
jgi:hypothetical protein